MFNKLTPIQVPHLVLCDDPSPQLVVVFEKLCCTNPILVYHNPAQWRQIREDAYTVYRALQHCYTVYRALQHCYTSIGSLRVQYIGVISTYFHKSRRQLPNWCFVDAFLVSMATSHVRGQLLSVEVSTDLLACCCTATL